jgi:hypothetical protein
MRKGGVEQIAASFTPHNRASQQRLSLLPNGKRPVICCRRDRGSVKCVDRGAVFCSQGEARAIAQGCRLPVENGANENLLALRFVKTDAAPPLEEHRMAEHFRNGHPERLGLCPIICAERDMAEHPVASPSEQYATLSARRVWVKKRANSAESSQWHAVSTPANPVSKKHSAPF